VDIFLAGAHVSSLLCDVTAAVWAQSVQDDMWHDGLLSVVHVASCLSVAVSVRCTVVTVSPAFARTISSGYFPKHHINRLVVVTET
jgi:hypothetical protein